MILTAGFIAVLLLAGTLNAGELVMPGDSDFEAYVPLLEGKKTAIFTNHTGIAAPIEILEEQSADVPLPENPEGTHILDALLQRGVNVSCVFSPEHGFRGNSDAGAKESDYVDESTGVKILSFYIANVSEAMSQHKDEFDIVLVDIQDVGVRFYTYYITMFEIMTACSELGKEVIVLDRPNPNGFYVDGPILTEGFKSRVGVLPLPVVHGLTLGEMAMMIRGEGWLNGECNLRVIPCRNYAHSTKVMLQCRPSPNLKTMRAVYLYPSTCYFENTLVTEGRGTNNPFELFGAPSLKGKNGYTFSFMPKSMPGATKPRYMNTRCYGQDLRVVPLAEIWNSGIELGHIAGAYRALGGRKDFFGRANRDGHYWMDLLMGTDSARNMIQSGKTADEIKASWQKELQDYGMLRSKYILYPN